MDNLTQEELEMLEACTSPLEWQNACDKVKAARNGNYPNDWWQTMKLSGRMDKIMNRWGSNSELKITSFE